MQLTLFTPELAESLKKLGSFSTPGLFSITGISLLVAYIVFLAVATFKYTKKPLAGLCIFLLSFVLYANDYTRALLVFDPSSPLIFTKFFFWVFFAIILGIDAIVYRKQPLRSLFLFIVSIFFYYKTSGLFFFMLLFTINMDYFLSKKIYSSTNERLRKVLVGISVAVNLGILCYFKYAYFFTESYNNGISTLLYHGAEFINQVFGTSLNAGQFQAKLKVINHFAAFANNFTGKDWFRVESIILPVGVSFYTFQTISYTVDVYKRQLQPARSLIDFGFYVSFFPQLVAGPIVRASEFIPQIYKPYALTRLQFGIGVFWILNGLAKKLFIGDYIAVNFIDRVYVNPSMYTGVENFLAVLGYSLQVYCDFSGYTDIAIGVAMLMGFQLTKNFNSPYKAEDVGDFWRRWHISLSTWLRDYLYIPLGGNRTASKGTFFWLILIGLLIALLTNNYYQKDFSQLATLKIGDIIVFACIAVLSLFAPVALLIYALGSARFQSIKNAITTEINMMLTMLIGGLWHGASWLFIIWGGLNGLGLVFFKRWKKISPLTGKKGVLIRVWGISMTFLFISFTRIFFRSPDMETAKQVINQIFYNFRIDLLFQILWGYKEVFVVMAIGMLFHWLPESFKEKYRQGFAQLPTPLMAAVVAIAVFVIYQSLSGELQAFIYFQF